MGMAMRETADEQKTVKNEQEVEPVSTEKVESKAELSPNDFLKKLKIMQTRSGGHYGLSLDDLRRENIY